MVCRYCNTLLPDTSIYCCTCGRKQLLVPRPRHRPRAHSEGSIVRLSGKRRCPYWARGPAEYNGRSVHRPSLGCYATYAAAAEALGRAKYCGSPESSPKQTTLRDIYNHFVDTHYYAELSRSAQSSHRTAWGHLAPCADTPIDVVNKQTFQLPIDELARKGLKRETLAKIRNLCSLLCKEAMGMGLLTINYGQLVQLPKTDKSAVAPFSSAELKLLWDLADTNHEGAMTILILCYTGMRPGELLSSRIEQHLHTEDSHWYLQTGSKTKAGRMRIIPIPTLIRPLILALIGGRTEGPLIAAPQGDHYRLDTWRNRVFKATMEQLHITGRVPYSGRHTYADLQKRRQVSPEVMMRVMGHEDYATTVEHYQTTTEEDISRLCSAVDGMERPS